MNLNINDSERLNVRNKYYSEFVLAFLNSMILDDIGEGDVTSNVVVSGGGKAKASIVAREHGVMAGEEELSFFFRNKDVRNSFNVEIDSDFKDGASFACDDVVLNLEGEIKDILRLERSILNFLQRMCALAKNAKDLYSSSKNLGFEGSLAATRKTLWGFFDKKAVSLGGVATHRLNLSDAIMIKDNHWKIFDRSGDSYDSLFAQLKESCLSKEIKFVDLEVDDQKRGLDLLMAAKQNGFDEIQVPLIIMLDNFEPERAQSFMLLAGDFNLPNTYIELSGGINRDNLSDYAKIPADIISMGCLTQGVKSLDLSLEIV